MLLKRSFLQAGAAWAAAACASQSWSYSPERPAPDAREEADLLAGIFANDKLPEQKRMAALKQLFTKHFARYGALPECAAFFKRCHWIQPGDWEVCRFMTGHYPFKEDGPFSPSWSRTLLVGVKMRARNLEVENLLWLGFPKDANITEDELGRLFSGACPERLAKLHLLDSVFNLP